MHVALIGNPNSGKTTVFNMLTGTHQRVGNWPGVTVEKKTGDIRTADGTVTLTDLPGVYSLSDVGTGLDERIARDFVEQASADVYLNIIDASSLSRGLYLTSELAQRGVPMVVAINMLDVAEQQGIEVDLAQLQQSLGCPVIGLVASRRQGKQELTQSFSQASAINSFAPGDEDARFAAIDQLVTRSTSQAQSSVSMTQRIDRIALHPIFAFPLFLGVMYLMFLISINVGSAFIDFFDIAGSAIFVEGPRRLLEAIALPAWLVIFLADGVGGGIQLVGTFIPVIGALFLVLSALEDSGYMALPRATDGKMTDNQTRNNGAPLDTTGLDASASSLVNWDDTEAITRG